MWATTTDADVGSNSRWGRGIRCNVASHSSLQTESSRRNQELWNAHEIIGGGGQHEQPFDQCSPAMSGFTQAAHSLHPAEGLFDLLSLDRADAMTGMTCGATIDRGADVS